MIEVKNLTMTFDKFVALDNLTCKIPSGCIYGLVGANGAGKSTLLRLMSDIYRPDSGEILIDGIKVHDNPVAKEKMMLVPDDLYFLPQSSMNRMAEMYKHVFPRFNMKRYKELTDVFKLNPKANIGTFSKGMKRQAALILAFSCMTDYVFCDETFDGLDPVVRNVVRQVLYSDCTERNSTIVLTSHSLRELEDTCDQLALLYKGGIVFESDVENLKTSLFKLQVAFSEDYDLSKFDELDCISRSKHGSVSVLIVRGDKETARNKVMAMNPILCELLPLSLEEVFVYEMDALGYVFDEPLSMNGGSAK